jgi:uncharacterized protein (DUF486 family)
VGHQGFIGNDARIADRRASAYIFPQSAIRNPQFPVKPFIIAPLLLVLSNVFMTFAWYGHLKNLNSKPWYIAAIISWLIAGAEYLFQVPGNRIGFSVMSLAQLKIMQEAITLAVFVPFAIFYMNEPMKMDYLYAGLCLVGAVYFIFRS